MLLFPCSPSQGGCGGTWGSSRAGLGSAGTAGVAAAAVCLWGRGALVRVFPSRSLPWGFESMAEAE